MALLPLAMATPFCSSVQLGPVPEQLLSAVNDPTTETD